MAEIGVRSVNARNPALVSIAAASGITPRTVATWYPQLVRTPRVLVPIELDVLMVRDSQLTWAATGMAVPPGGEDHEPVPASSLMPAPFTDLAESRPRGAYLQWYLPNGLTGGTVDNATGQASFPAIPDRWLVLRIAPGTQIGRRAVRGWVLDGGGEPAQVFDLDGWTETGAAPDVENPLTALGHGDVSWAGYFDNVVNRLGFYDGTLDDDRMTGPIAYLVCGWYRDPTADPLGAQSVTSLADFNATMAQLSFTLESGQLEEVQRARLGYMTAASRFGLVSERFAGITDTGAFPTTNADGEYVTDGAWWPTATVYHGAVVGISWPGDTDTAEAGGPPDPSTITVATGNTMAETIGAIVAAANSAPEQAAIVEALQLGIINELDQPDGRAQLDVALHTSSFASQSGGASSTEPLAIAPSGPPPAPPASQPTPGPGIFAAGEAAAAGSGGGAPLQGVRAGSVGVERAISEMHVPSGASAGVAAEETLIHGSLNDVMTHLGAGATLPPTDPGGTIDAQRPVPRRFIPKDPIVLVQGAKRAFSHDSSVPTEDGLVVCRLTPVSELSWIGSDGSRRSVGGSDVLERGVENGSVPLECEGLLQETALLDIGSAPAISAAAGETGNVTSERNVTVEQTAWYALRNPAVDHGPLLARSGISGMLPSPIAVAPPSRPWTPMHLDWEVEYVASPDGVEDWELEQLDYVLGEQATVPGAGKGVTFIGRSPVTGGASATLSSAINNALNQAASVGGSGGVPVPSGTNLARERFYSPLAQNLVAQFAAMHIDPSTSDDAATPAQLQSIATALSQMDVLSCGLGGLLLDLRGGVPPDGISTPPGGTLPTPFFALRAGFLRLVRLRLVDGFGQFVDLCGSSASVAASGYLVSDPLSVTGASGVLGLPPRFSSPTRAWFRFMSAEDPTQEADYQTSPICAYVLPNHLEGSLEFFNADGGGAGSLAPDPGGQVTWSNAPGMATGAGQDPSGVLTNQYAIALARSLLDWGIADAGQDREVALSALLRTIDSTMWSVDPFGHAGDEHLSLLVGHPVCVIRALLRLEVDDPVTTPDGTLTAVPLRLGDLTQWQDGLLGYFVNDDYTTLHVADASAPAMARQVGPGQASSARSTSSRTSTTRLPMICRTALLPGRRP